MKIGQQILKTQLNTNIILGLKEKVLGGSLVVFIVGILVLMAGVLCHTLKVQK
jgi:hypothetical protein